MSYCPHCKKYKLSFYEKVFLNNWVPAFCKSCGKAYVNSPKSVIYTLTIGVFVVVRLCCLVWSAGVSINGIWAKALPVLIVIAGFLLYGFFANPIKHEDLVMYGKRPWWGNIILFGFLPILFITAVLLILIGSGVGN